MINDVPHLLAQELPDLIPKVHEMRLKMLGGPGCRMGCICNMSVVVGRRQVQARIRRKT